MVARPRENVKGEEVLTSMSTVDWVFSSLGRSHFGRFSNRVYDSSKHIG